MSQSDDWRQAPTAKQMRNVVRTIDPSVAHIARIQDHWLGGKDHVEADRVAGDEAIAQPSNRTSGHLTVDKLITN